MRKVRFVAMALFVVPATIFAGAGFSATELRLQKPLPRGVVIRNNSHSITAFQFFGDISKALVSLRSLHTVPTHSFGSVLFQSNATAVVPPELAQFIREAAATHGVDPRLIAAVAMQESRFNPNAVSPVGALGLMQLMPATAKFLGVQNPLDARENVMAGTRYLKTLLNTFHGDLDLSLAAYNAGPGAVHRFGGVPPYRETMNYVSSIRHRYELAISVQ